MQVLNANADVLTTAKLRELSPRATDIQPRIIAVSEVKPKNFTRTRTEADYQIDGYELESLGLGSEEARRGMIVYLKLCHIIDWIFPELLVTWHRKL